MLVLWTVFFGLLVLALGFIVWPLLRHTQSYEGETNDSSSEVVAREVVARAQLNTSIYKERLLELQAEYHEGNVSESQFNELELELQRTLLSDVPSEAANETGGMVSEVAASSHVMLGKPVIIVAIVTVVFSLAVTGFYGLSVRDDQGAHWISVQEKMGPVLDQALYGISMTDEKFDYSYADFIRSLQSHLQSNQDNVGGWVLLGKAYQEVDMPGVALEAFQRAYALAPLDIEVMLGLAGTKIYLGKGKLDDESRQLIDAVLRREPNNVGGLMLKGMSSFSSGLYQEAIDAWEGLLQLRQGDSATEQSQKGEMALQKSIALARERLESGVTLLDKPLIEIKVIVEIAPSLRSQLRSSDILFVFAKAVDGPPMPIAAVKRTVREFPIEVTLDDSAAMTDRMKLSNFKQVRVEARISKSGQPIAQAGDFQAAGQIVQLRDVPVNANGQTIKITIDSIL